MEKITDKEYPAQPLWFLKEYFSIEIQLLLFIAIVNLFSYLFFYKIIFSSTTVLYFFIITSPLTLLSLFFNKKIIRFSFENNYLIINYFGYVKTSKNISYKNIKNVKIKQGVFNKIFSLYNINIRCIKSVDPDPLNNDYMELGSVIVEKPTEFNIVGLSKENANALEKILIEKIK